MLNTTPEQRAVLKKFVAYMASVNDNDAFKYDMAIRRLKENGAHIYWDCEIRGVKDLYKEIGAYCTGRATFLQIDFERLDNAPTCVPTRDTVEANKRSEEALMRDYWDSVERNWSTE